MKNIWHTHNSVYRWLLQDCTLETYIIVLANVITINLIKNIYGTILGMEITQWFFERNEDRTIKMVGEILLSLFCC